jgi:hypothetical protein
MRSSDGATLARFGRRKAINYRTNFAYRIDAWDAGGILALRKDLLMDGSRSW